MAEKEQPYWGLDTVYGEETHTLHDNDQLQKQSRMEPKLPFLLTPLSGERVYAAKASNSTINYRPLLRPGILFFVYGVYRRDKGVLFFLGFTSVLLVIECYSVFFGVGLGIYVYAPYLFNIYCVHKFSPIEKDSIQCLSSRSYNYSVRTPCSIALTMHSSLSYLRERDVMNPSAPL